LTVRYCEIFKLMLIVGVASGLVVSARAQQQVPEPLELTLDQAIELALENNYNIRLTDAALREAKAAVGEAKSANRFQIGLEGTYSRLGPVTTIEMPTPTGSALVQLAPDEAHKYGVTLYKSLYSSGRNQALATLARLNVDIAKLQTTIVRRQITLATAQVFYGVSRALGFVDVSQQAVQGAKEHWQMAKARYEAGAVPRLDVMRAEVDVANAEQDLIAAQNAVESAKAMLKNILAIDVTRPLQIVTEPEVQPVTVDAQNSIELAYQRREEISAAQAGLEASLASARLARSGRGVDLDLAGGYNRQGVGGLGSADYSWSLTVALSKPLSDGGASRSKEQQALQQAEQARLAIGQLKDQIALEVWQACLDLEEAKARLSSTQKTVEAAVEAHRISQIRYKAGIATPVEVTDARVALTAARTNHVDALYGYHVAEAKLLSAVNISKDEISLIIPEE